LSSAREQNVPTIYWNRSLVVAGGLMSYGPNITDLSTQSADYVDRILKGTRPADLPVQTPVRFQLVVNARTAKALRLDIPPNVLALADEVIE
jgi:putative tryptophan/tyrosine transport system substrate-binding protein